MRNWHDGVFFGLHFDIHANAADQHLGRDVTVDHLLEQFQKIRPDFVQCDCKGHPGYASYPTKVGVPAPGIEKDALRVWREATKRLGIPLVMHFSGVWDRVAVERHPEWARVPSARERASGEVGVQRGGNIYFQMYEAGKAKLRPHMGGADSYRILNRW